MVYCSNCGSKIDDEAYFCPKCGTKTPKGKATKVAYPADEILDAFYQAGLELEKGFTTAAKETHAAFKKVKEGLQEKTASNTSSQNTIVCPKCSAKNTAGSIFCHNCGSRIVPSEGARGSV